MNPEKILEIVKNIPEGAGSSPSWKRSRKNTATFRKMPCGSSPSATGRPADGHLRGGHFLQALQLEAAGKAPDLWPVRARPATSGEGRAIAEEIERQLEIPPGGTTPDGEVSFETVNCLGACALGPMVVVDGHYFVQRDPGRVKEILREDEGRARPGGCLHGRSGSFPWRSAVRSAITA